MLDKDQCLDNFKAMEQAASMNLGVSRFDEVFPPFRIGHTEIEIWFNSVHIYLFMVAWLIHCGLYISICLILRLRNWDYR